MGVGRPLLCPSFFPLPPPPPFAASPPPLIGWPQTLSFPWDLPASALRHVAADASRLSPGPGRGGVGAKSRLVRGDRPAISAAVSPDRSRSRKRPFGSPPHPSPIPPFLFPVCFLSLPLPVLIWLFLLVPLIWVSAYSLSFFLSWSSCSFLKILSCGIRLLICFT